MSDISQVSLEETLEELKKYEVRSDLWTFLWKFPADSRLKVGILEGILGHVLEKAGFSKDKIYDAILVSEEALTNAIKHGSKGNREKHVAFGVNLFPPKTACIAEFFCEDEGEGFRSEDVSDPLKNLEADHGRGILLMRAYADGLAYNRKGNRVEWYILNNF